MAYGPVRICSHRSRDPARQENFSVICHDHRVRTIVTATPAVVRKWVGSIRHRHRYQLRRGRLVVGLGVQWSPLNRTRPATLQLCVGHQCLVFQLIYAARSPLALRRFLSDRSIIFVGVWNNLDSDVLRNSDHRLHISRLVDVRHVASDMGKCSLGASMEKLTEAILGMDGVEKEEWVGRSEWDRKWLKDEQVGYACVDAFVAFLMAKTLRVWKWVEDNYSSDGSFDS